ncbi:RluA family pseudouridine synthase [Candidatus Aalborgicola defluviihabitans]|uniref:RluA family pseudouridine synthase n=1 Tax=Candidatus Aalborgicola defluviihabitans TaxID=3386187 RepID=UPI001EB7B93D|nr:RluA family pseudouridine synthase [Burkholderiales bacterium]
MKQSTGIISIHPIVAESEELEDVSTEVEWRTDTVNVAQHGERLDRALVDMVPEFSRSYLQQLIDLGLVCLNSQPVRKPSTRVKAADSVTIELRPTPQSQAFKPQNIPLEVVYRDAHILVINKPAGLVVHPAPGNWSGTLLNALLAYDSDIALVPRAGIVHRLDKDTSGLMVVARTRAVMDTLIQAIAARDVSRQYLAVAHGQWSGPNSRTVDAPIGRDPRNRLRMAIVNLASQSGKMARTDFILLDNAEKGCLVRCTLHTGRTHQIRVHMASLGHPLVADVTYGGSTVQCMERQALHAVRLAFVHPVTGEPMVFEAPVPIDIVALMDSWGLRYNPQKRANGP